MSSRIRHGFHVGLLCVAAGIAVAGHQFSTGPEATLLAQIKAQPDRLPPYLALANLYWASRRYSDADRILSAALEQLQKRSADPVAPSSTTPLPVGVDIPAPARVREVNPTYPSAAFEARIGGMVRVDVVVDERGLVRDARVTKSVSGLDDAALEAARQWEFVPTFRGDRAMVLVVPLVMTFIPEPTVTVPQAARRDLTPAIAAASRFVELGASAAARGAIESVVAAIRREIGAAPVAEAAAITTGRTSAVWPLRAGQDVDKPARVQWQLPLFPADALARHVDGVITFEFVVDPEGRVANIRRTSVPTIDLDTASRAALGAWTFTPTRIAGEAVPVAMTQSFNFSATRKVVEEVVRLSPDAGPPTVRRSVRPVMPEAARARREQGSVVMDVVVDRAGKVVDVRVVASAGDRLDIAAVAAVRQWEYAPAVINGAPASIAITVTVSFSAQ